MRLRSALLALAAILLGALGWLALLGDARLDEDVARALERPPRLPLEENLFYPLSGFGTARGEDPAEAGYRAVTRVNALLLADDGTTPQATADAVEAAWVASPAALEDPGGVLCPLAEPGCIASIRAAATELRRLADGHRWLLARYDTLAGFPRFQSDLVPHPSMPLPRLSLLLEVHRLAAARHLLDALEGDPRAARALAADVAFLRRLLRQADGMLVKMVAAALLAETLHAYAAALDGSGRHLDALPPLAPLDGAERSMEAAFRGEFRFVAAGVTLLTRGDALHRELGLPAWMGHVAIRPLFKPNRTLNREHACWKALQAQGAVGLAEPCLPGWSDWLLNPVGTILSTVSRADHGRYALRLRDLAGLITLVNARRALREEGVPEAGVAAYLVAHRTRFAGPHGGDTVRFDPDDRSLRFGSPLEVSGYNRLYLEPLAHTPAPPEHPVADPRTTERPAR